MGNRHGFSRYRGVARVWQRGSERHTAGIYKVQLYPLGLFEDGEEGGYCGAAAKSGVAAEDHRYTKHICSQPGRLQCCAGPSVALRWCVEEDAVERGVATL